jgi:hypothetical protein
MTKSWLLENLSWIGPTAGMAEAFWGGCVGLIAYSLMQKGRGRPLIYGLLYLGLVAALAFFAIAAVAWARGEPTIVVRSFAMLGGPILIAASLSLVSVSKSYRQAELRRMQALEQ